MYDQRLRFVNKKTFHVFCAHAPCIEFTNYTMTKPPCMYEFITDLTCPITLLIVAIIQCVCNVWNQLELWLWMTSRAHNKHSLLSLHVDDIQVLSDKYSTSKICLPKRLIQRWRKITGNHHCFNIANALSMVQVTYNEFKKCWRTVKLMLPDNEIFCIFEKTFGPRNNLAAKVDFVKEILQRYKAMGEPVSWCV